MAAQNPAAARNIAYCITQLALTDKAVRRLGEQWRSYQAALADPTVVVHFKVGRKPLPPTLPAKRCGLDQLFN